MEPITQLLSSVFDMIAGAFNFLFEAIDHTLLNRNTKYKADFSTPGILLSRFNRGFCLTGLRNLTCKDSHQNAMVIGGTGVGKSSVVLIPSLFTMRGSYVVNDTSGELFMKDAGILEKKNYQIKVLDYTRPENSSGYNPLSRANNSTDIQKVASMLVTSSLGSNSKDPFWNISATSLLSMLITIVKTQDEQYQNLYNVRQLLNRLGGDPASVDSLFARYADEPLFAEYKSFLSYDDKVISGVTATCKAALQLFNDEAVAKVTSWDNIDFMEFRQKPTVLFIRNSVSDQRYYSVLTSIFHEQFFSFILNRFPSKDEQDIFLLVDEAASLNVPTLPAAMANVRKHRAGIMLLLQDYNQLLHNYGKYEADGIRANCFAKLFFTGQSLETATELERILGKFEFKDSQGHKVVRSLMTSDEIRMMKINRALLVCGHHPPIKVRLRPYYKRAKFRQYASIPPPEIVNENLADSIAILPVHSNLQKQDV
jgi:type IV secretion system protein VirD4